MKNNFATMHSALTSAYMVLVKAYMDNCPIPSVELVRVISILEQAVALKPRNCDVGTAEGQTQRYRKFCSAHKYLGSDFSYLCKAFGKGRCPFFNNRTKSQCEFAWAQMSYKEGDTK